MIMKYEKQPEPEPEQKIDPCKDCIAKQEQMEELDKELLKIQEQSNLRIAKIEEKEQELSVRQSEIYQREADITRQEDDLKLIWNELVKLAKADYYKTHKYDAYRVRAREAPEYIYPSQVKECYPAIADIISKYFNPEQETQEDET